MNLQIFGDFSNITSKYRYFTLVVTELNGSGGIIQMTEFSIIGVEDINNTPTLIDASNNTYTISLPYSDTTTVKTINDPKIRITVNDNLIAYYDFNGDYLDKNPTDTKYNLSVSEHQNFHKIHESKIKVFILIKIMNFYLHLLISLLHLVHHFFLV